MTAAVDWSVPRRTHPWSIVVSAVHEGRRVITALVVALLGGRALGGGQLVEMLVPAGAVVLGVLAWARTSFRVAPEEFRLDTGVLFRQSRTARFDRIQAIDIDQPAVARLFGLAELRLQLGGGRHGHFRLACVRRDEAARLRAYLLERVAQAAGPATGSSSAVALGSAGQQIGGGASQAAAVGTLPVGAAYGGGVPYGAEVDEEPLVTVPNGIFLASLALSSPIWLALLAVVGSFFAVRTGSPQAIGAAVPEALGVVGYAWDRFQRYYGFTLALSGDGIRLRHGLLTRFAQTVPVSRLQAVEISQPLLWRRAGWSRVRMNVAGYASGGGRGEAGRRNTAVLLPVVPSHIAFAIAGRLLNVDLAAMPLSPVPERARWRAFAWRRGYWFGFDDTVVVARRGLLHRRHAVIPHAKVQSLHLVQGPWQRSLSLASVALHSTRGPVKILIKHRDVAEAQELLEQQSRRSATARRVTR